MTNKEFFIKTLSDEMQITAGAVNALPEDMDKLSYRPDPKSRSAIEIVGHMLPHVEGMKDAVKTFVIKEDGIEFTSREEAVEYLSKNTAELVENLKTVDDKTWDEKVVPFEYMGSNLFEAPMYEMYWMFLLDIIHHRGQLSSYYRSMGVRNPQIYGPTADDVQSA
ncbi:MAG: DinB family protein [Ignavibacteria bacterium]